MLCTDIILCLQLREKGNFPKCWRVTSKNCSFYHYVTFPRSFCCLVSVSLQNSTCELNSSCGGKDPLWSPSSLCGMATPPSSRGMSPNLELSHSASHLPSRFHCTSGRRSYDYNRFPLGWRFIEVFIMFLTEWRSGIFFFSSNRGVVLIWAGGKGTPASSTPATSSPPPTLSDDFPIISLPANPVQSSPPRKVRSLLSIFPCFLEKCLILPMISSSSSKSLGVNLTSLNIWKESIPMYVERGDELPSLSENPYKKHIVKLFRICFLFSMQSGILQTNVKNMPANPNDQMFSSWKLISLTAGGKYIFQAWLMSVIPHSEVKQQEVIIVTLLILSRSLMCLASCLINVLFKFWYINIDIKINFSRIRQSSKHLSTCKWMY